MYAVFAFNNAEPMDTTPAPIGSYDAEQQLWVDDDASYATDPQPPVFKNKTKLVTRSRATLSPTGLDMEIDYLFD